MPPAIPRLGQLGAAICLVLAYGLPHRAPLYAQVTTANAPAADRWSVDAHNLHAGAAPIRRHAGTSMAVTLARTFGRSTPTRAPRLEVGWLRASRVRTQAQGVTLGASLGLPIGPRAPWDTTSALLTLRPGAALLAGWAEAQTATLTYDWRGLPDTPYAGQTGTQTVWRPVRGRTTGAGLSLGADLHLTNGLSVVGSVRHWTFTGPVIRPNRQATLAGLGIAARPRALAHEARAWWRSWTAPLPTPPRPTVPQYDAAATTDTAAVRGRGW